jgi:hypothetical protein
MNFLFFLIVALIFEKITGQGDASNACSNVLQQGVYNTFSSSSSKSSYSEFQSAMCSMTSTMTYSEYLNSGRNAQSSSNYYSWNTAASFLGIDLSGGSSGGTSDMTESEFTQFQKAANSYQSSYCASNSGNSGSSELFNQYMQTINPAVYTAYQSCISLYTTGIQFSSQYGYGSSSAYINVEFSSSSFGSKAIITGFTVFPENTAACQLFGDLGLSAKFYMNMIPDETYSIICKSYNNASVDVVSIGISTTQGIYMTYLYNRQPAALLSQLQAQVNQLQTEQAILKSKIRPVKITAFGTAGSYVFTSATNPAPLYIKVKVVGAGAGGGTGYTYAEIGEINNRYGIKGKKSVFGDNILFATGGEEGGHPGSGDCGAQESCWAQEGGEGSSSPFTFSNTNLAGGHGGSSPIGGVHGHGGDGGFYHGGVCNQGGYSGHGGGGGGYVEAILSRVEKTYLVVVGEGGSGAPEHPNSCSTPGLNGADGLVLVEEYFQ